MEPAAPEAAPPVAPTPEADVPLDPSLRIDWEVKNRFRLFRREADFQRHVTANRAGSLLAAERSARARAPTAAAGPATWSIGSASTRAGTLLDTCERDGERENLSGAGDHRIGVTARRPGAGGRDLQLELRRRHHPAETGQRALQRGGQAAAALRQADHRHRRHHAAGRQRRQRLGRDRGARSADRRHGRLDRRRRRQSGPRRSRSPTRASASAVSSARRAANITGPAAPAINGDKACDDSASGSSQRHANGRSHGARWMTAACHRSLYGYQMRTALALAIENPQHRRHLPAARLHRRDDRERPVRRASAPATARRRTGAPCRHRAAARSTQLQDLLATGAQAARRPPASISCC